MEIWKLASLRLRQRVSQLSGIPCTFIDERSSPLTSSHGGSTSHSPSPQPFISQPTSQSLSADLYKTTPTDLNKHVLGVCDPPKDKVSVASNCHVYNFVVFRDFCSVVRKSLMKSRKRRKPQQSPLDDARDFDVSSQRHQNFIFLHGNGEFRYPFVSFQGIIADPLYAFHDGYEPLPQVLLRGFLSITRHGFGVDPYARCKILSPPILLLLPIPHFCLSLP